MAVAVKPRETIRQHLTEAAPALAPGVLASLEEASRSTKSAWGTCGHCKRRVQVEIQDAQAAIAASRALMDYTEGKPGTAGEDETDPLQVTRAVDVTVDAASALALLDAGQLEQLRAELVSSLPVAR